MEMRRRSFLGAMLAAAMAPAFVKAESLMKIAAPTGWTTTDGGILVQETSDGFLTYPRFVSIDMYRGIVEPVADPAGKDNLLLHPSMARSLYTGEVGKIEGFRMIETQLRMDPTPSGKRLLAAMRDGFRRV